MKEFSKFLTLLNLDLTPGNVKNKALTKDITHLLEGSGRQQLLSVCGHESLATLEQRLVIVTDVVSQSSRPLLLNGYRDSLIKKQQLYHTTASTT